MGRGRAKAKQTRVARDLKYRSVNTDFASLERELRGGTDGEESLHEEIPEQCADLVEAYESDDADRFESEDEDEDEDLRRSS